MILAALLAVSLCIRSMMLTFFLSLFWLRVIFMSLLIYALFSGLRTLCSSILTLQLCLFVTLTPQSFTEIFGSHLCRLLVMSFKKSLSARIMLDSTVVSLKVYNVTKPVVRTYWSSR